MATYTSVTSKQDAAAVSKIIKNLSATEDAGKAHPKQTLYYSPVLEYPLKVVSRHIIG